MLNSLLCTQQSSFCNVSVPRDLLQAVSHLRPDLSRIGLFSHREFTEVHDYTGLGGNPARLERLPNGTFTIVYGSGMRSLNEHAWLLASKLSPTVFIDLQTVPAMKALRKAVVSLRSVYIIAACATVLVLYWDSQYRKVPLLKSKLSLTQIVLQISHDVTASFLKVAV